MHVFSVNDSISGNPWPPVKPRERDMSGSLVNIILQEARKDFRKQKYEESSSAATPDMSGTDPSIDNSSIQSEDLETEELASRLEHLDVKEQTKSNSKDGKPV